MNLDLLLRRLEEIGVEITEKKLSEGKELMLKCSLPFPHVRKASWYPLPIAEGQTEVPKPEVLAILRHLWHTGKECDWFPEDYSDLIAEFSDEPPAFKE